MHWVLAYDLLTFQPRKKLCPLAFSVRDEVFLEFKTPDLELYYRRSHCLVVLTNKEMKSVYICLDFKLGNT